MSLGVAYGEAFGDGVPAIFYPSREDTKQKIPILHLLTTPPFSVCARLDARRWGILVFSCFDAGRWGPPTPL